MSDRQLPDYAEFARLLYSTCIISDPWLAGNERFRIQPAILTADLGRQLAEAAERIAYIYHEVAGIVGAHPELLDNFYQLTPFQKAMWMASEGHWHGIARVDLFACTDGRVRSCEMNSDTPSGEAEATIVNELLHPYFPETLNPNLAFADRFWRLLENSHHAVTGKSKPPQRVAIIYPTDLPEDLSMIAVYRKWLEERGCEVLIGSPYNLGGTRGGRVTVMGKKVDLIIRHYKTDWWGERETIWTNQQPYADADPLDRELGLILEAENRHRVTVVNPFGSVVTQNKISMALMWEHRDLFSAQASEWIEQYIPETRRVADLKLDELERAEWVLKSDYGCEGDSVVIGAQCSPVDWQLMQATMVPEHWVAQRYFEVEAIDGMLPNYGVYVMEGEAAGFFTRVSEKSTDYTAVSCATFISAD